MANDTTQNKATDADRFEVLQQSIQDLSQIVAKACLELAATKIDMATANERIAALSAQVSQPVMGIKVEEPKTRQGTRNLTPDGWDTTAKARQLAEEAKAA